MKRGSLVIFINFVQGNNTMCQLGNIKFGVGEDVLEMIGIDVKKVRVSCRCEIPPIPTCTYGIRIN